VWRKKYESEPLLNLREQEPTEGCPAAVWTVEVQCELSPLLPRLVGENGDACRTNPALFLSPIGLSYTRYSRLFRELARRSQAIFNLSLRISPIAHACSSGRLYDQDRGIMGYPLIGRKEL
jgi:hypothetical protein